MGECLPIPIGHYNFTACPTTTNQSALSVRPIANPANIMGALMANPAENHFQCDPTKGLFSLFTLGQDKERLESVSTMQNFHDHFDAPNAFSIAIWLQPNDIAQSGLRAIITIGITNDIDGPLLPCGEPYHLRIAQVENHFEVSFADSNHLCSTLPINVYELVSDQLTHLVITFGERSMQVYINGSPLYPDGALYETIHIPSWDYMNQSTLQLFSNYIADDQVFHGRIHQMDFYDVFLSDYQVATLFSGGVGFWRNDGVDEEVEELLQRIPNYDPRPLVASPLIPTIIMDQNDTLRFVPISLKSCNQSNPTRQYAIQTTVSPRNGSLFRAVVEAQSNASLPTPPLYQEIQVNDLLVLQEDSMEVIVYYRLASPEYFNIPTHNGYGSDLHVRPEFIQYRVVELDPSTARNLNTHVNPSDRELVKASETRTVPIFVARVNDGPSNLLVPSDVVTRVNENTVVIRGVDIIMESNLNIDQFRVDVFLPSSMDGALTVNPTYWSLLSAGSAMELCRTRWYSGWQCTTDALNASISRSSITFVALPSDIPWIINEMMVTTYTSDDSNITIRVHDGIGGECLDAQEHWTLNNATSNAVDTWWSSLMVPQPNETARFILDHRFHRNSSCVASETVIHIPGSDVAFATNQDVTRKMGLKILGFEWKEFLFGAMVIISLVFCLWGCCRLQIL